MPLAGPKEMGTNLRQEAHSNGILSERRQRHGRMLAHDAREESVWHANENSCAIAGRWIFAAGTAMLQTAEHAQRILHECRRSDAAQLYQHTDTACVTLM